MVLVRGGVPLDDGHSPDEILAFPEPIDHVLLLRENLHDILGNGLGEEPTEQGGLVVS